MFHVKHFLPGDHHPFFCGIADVGGTVIIVCAGEALAGAAEGVGGFGDAGTADVPGLTSGTAGAPPGVLRDFIV